MPSTITIVSGMVRSGTSCMMQCLVAGGLESASRPGRERMSAVYGDQHYQPNPGGFHEVDPGEYRAPDFPIQYAGKLIKVMWWGLPCLAVHDYRVVLMRRDPEEVRQSWEAMTGKPLRGPLIERYDEYADGFYLRMQNRRDVRSLVEVRYRDLVEMPAQVLCGPEFAWLPHPEKAASVPDPEQCRFRRERLEAGL